MNDAQIMQDNVSMGGINAAVLFSPQDSTVL